VSKWDTFEDEVKAVAASSSRERCGVNALLNKLGPSDRTKVTALLENPEYTTVAIGKVIRRRIKNGPSDSTIQRHRNGNCSCN
jgi:hypothetical protein